MLDINNEGALEAGQCMDELIRKINSEITGGCMIPIKLPKKESIRIIDTAKEWFYKHYEDSVQENYYAIDKSVISSPSYQKTKSFELICLHESADREYLHGYHNIHALAYENYNNNNDNYESIFESDNKDNLPLLVFHYGLSLREIESMLERRNYIIKNDSFVDVQSIKY